MTEPTVEQVGHERGRAHLTLVAMYGVQAACMHPDHNTDCTVIATALARRALEVRDEALREAEQVAREMCSTDYPDEYAAAIRALRSGGG